MTITASLNANMVACAKVVHPIQFLQSLTSSKNKQDKEEMEEEEEAEEEGMLHSGATKRCNNVLSWSENSEIYYKIYLF